MSVGSSSCNAWHRTLLFIPLLQVLYTGLLVSFVHIVIICPAHQPALSPPPGKASIHISSKLHEVPIRVSSLTLLSQAFLAAQE